MSQEFVRRRDVRNSVQMAARCQTKNGVRGEGWLSDISATGCCVETRNIYVDLGMRMLIRPQGMEGLTGVVRWIEGQRFGLEFDAPLYGPVVEHLVAAHGERQSLEVSSR